MAGEEGTDMTETFLGLFLEKPTIILTLAVIAFLLGVTAIIFNSSVIVFYFPKYREVYPMMYLFNCVCDCLAGVAAILVGVVLVQLYRDAEDETSSELGDTPPSTALIGTVFCVVSTTVRVSVICSLSISVVRLINIVWLQYSIRYRLLLGALMGILLFWIAFTAAELSLSLKGGCVDMTDDKTDSGTLGPRKSKPEKNKASEKSKTETANSDSIAIIEELFLQPFVGKELLCTLENAVGKKAPNGTEIFLLEVIPFIIPVCLATFILVLTSYKLLKTPVGRNSEVSRNITITVSWLTLFYILCNVPFFVVLCKLGHPDKNNSSTTTVVVRFVTVTMLPFLSACLVPGTLIIRGSKIKRYFSEKINKNLQMSGLGGRQPAQNETKES